MTRENKLALIIGFGLLLFVGILVSDHFSTGRRQEAANLVLQRGERQRPEISLTPMGAANSPTVVKAPEAEHPESRTASNTRTGPAVPPTGGLEGPAGGTRGAPTPTGEGSELVAIVPPPQGGSATGPASGQADVKFHPVKEGETLYKIALAEYGDGSVWQALADFNKSAVPDPARMRNGTTIRIPPIEVLKPGAKAMAKSTPRVEESAGALERVDKPGTKPTEPGAGTAVATSYTIQKGDTIFSIASRKLGSKGKWKELAELNRDVVKDPDSLVPGTVIKLPAKG